MSSKEDAVVGDRLDAVLDKLPLSHFHVRLLFIAGLAFAADAMEVSLLGFLSSCVASEFGLGVAEQATISSVVFVGELIGSLFWGRIADYFGRRLSLLIATVLISVGGWLSGVAPNYASLLFFRAAVGFGVGGLSVAFDLLAEFLPPANRGRWLMYIEYFWTAGSVLVTGLAWALLNIYGWRNLCFFTAIPVTLSATLSTIMLPESPRWLIAKGRYEEAEIVVKKAAAECGVLLEPFVFNAQSLGPLCSSSSASSSSSSSSSTTTTAAALASPEYDVSTSTRHYKQQHHQDPLQQNQQGDSEHVYKDLLYKNGMWKTTLPLWIVWFLFGFTYYGLILLIASLYSTSSSSSSSIASCSFDYQDIFLSACAEFLGVTMCALVIDRWGRVRSQISFYLLAAASVLCLAGGPQGITVYGFVAMSMLARVAAMGASCATWVATPELYPRMCEQQVTQFATPSLVLVLFAHPIS